ncbi:putative uDENN domain-containing protein [Helianthus annuus]|nr:putative uDENN domain-containing protein [Helianthus annuus]
MTSGGHRRCRSEIVSSVDEANGFQRFKTHMQRALNWGGTPDQAFFNPDRKRHWAQFHSNPLVICLPPPPPPQLFLYIIMLITCMHACMQDTTTKYEDTTTLFEHFLIAGIHPNANLDPVEDAFAKSMHFQSPPVVIMEPQILFKYPPGNRLPMPLSDMASFCFPEGVKVSSQSHYICKCQTRLFV